MVILCIKFVSEMGSRRPSVDRETLDSDDDDAHYEMRAGARIVVQENQNRHHDDRSRSRSGARASPDRRSRTPMPPLYHDRYGDRSRYRRRRRNHRTCSWHGSNCTSISPARPHRYRSRRDWSPRRYSRSPRRSRERDRDSRTRSRSRSHHRRAAKRKDDWASDHESDYERYDVSGKKGDRRDQQRSLTPYYPRDSKSPTRSKLKSCVVVDSGLPGTSSRNKSLFTNRSMEATLKLDLFTMMDDTLSSDAVLRAGEREFPCHKVVLRARSAVFRAMFEHNMLENESNIVEIEDIQPDVLAKLVQYIYTGEVTMLSDVTLDLYAAADKYDLRKLCDLCESVAIEQLAIETLGDIIVFADIHGAKRLWKYALRFAHKNSERFLKIAGWETLLLTRPDLVTGIVKAISGLDRY